MILSRCNICDKFETKTTLKTIHLQLTPNSVEEYMVCDNCMSTVVNIIKMLREKR